MIYLAVLNASVLHATSPPPPPPREGDGWGVGEGKGSREGHGHPQKRRQDHKDFPSSSVQSLRRTRIFCPQIQACVKEGSTNLLVN